ncbi:outer membrane protein assembly factor BamD [bacterium]|nr:outer membrane protein assembly factor BamD [bacterium]
MTANLGLFFAIQSLLWFNCGGYKVPPNLSAEERFDLGKRMFANRDYVDSKAQFKILTLNYPGIKFMDEAQFLLAESHFNMKEYILASDEYNRLVRLYPNSQWVDDSQFKIGVCDFKLSPKPSLDQKYTFQAIQNLQRFIEDFPISPLIPEAEKLLNISRGKIAEKEFKTGDLYRKLKDHSAALVYYNSVLATYYDTPYAEGALFWKGQCLLKLDRHEASLGAFEEFVQKYPKSRMHSEALAKIKDLRKQLRQAQKANGDS